MIVVLVLLILLALAGVAGQRGQWFGAGQAPVADDELDHSADSAPESGQTEVDAKSAPAGTIGKYSADDSAPNKPEDQAQSPSKTVSTPMLSTETANALMREQLRERDCLLARLAIKGDREERFKDRDWQWLPPERAALERQALVAVVERLRAACPKEIDDPEARKRHQRDNDDATAAAAQAGNLLARVRLESRKPRARRNFDDTRALMIEALRAGDLEAISELGWLELGLPGTNPYVGHLVNPLDLWPLVACDLGADCGPGSRLLDLSCATAWFGMTCGYNSLESAYRDNMPSHVWQRLDQRRNEILNRLRSGQTDGMFDPPPTNNRPGGG
ncbi:MAG: hypothetical protein AB7E72_17920 [Lysobacterales bacterium]